jgi:hypothetical protein
VTEVGTLGGYTKAQTCVKLQAEIVTQCWGGYAIGSALTEQFCAEVWRLARH